MPQKLYSRTEHLHIMVPSYLMSWIIGKCEHMGISRTEVVLMYLKHQYLKEQESNGNVKTQL